MKIKNYFTDDEGGAVTVDWVVLTATIVLIAAAVISSISSGVRDLSGAINGSLEIAAVDLRGNPPNTRISAVALF